MIFHIHTELRAIGDGKAVELPICFKGFQSLFGVKPFTLHTIKIVLRQTGKLPTDKRGTQQ